MSVSLDIRPQVAAFALLMEAKLRENDHKGHWKDEALGYLLGRLEEERRELDVAVERWRTYRGRAEDRINVGREAADVANFAMMLADSCGALAATPPATREAAPAHVPVVQHAKATGSLWRVLVHHANDSDFAADEVVRFIGGPQNDKFEHLNGRAHWYLSDEFVEAALPTKETK